MEGLKSNTKRKEQRGLRRQLPSGNERPVVLCLVRPADLGSGKQSAEMEAGAVEED